MNCASSTIKYLLYLLNVIFVIGGISLIVIGALIVKDLNNLRNVETAINTELIPIVIITLGAVIFVVSFFGCCGTIKENSMCTNIYAILMFILFVAQITLSVWIFMNRVEFLKSLDEFVQKTIHENANENGGYPLDAIQIALNCCGVSGYEDYQALNLTVPSSCCGYPDIYRPCEAQIYQLRAGCETALNTFWTTQMTLIIGVGIGIAVFELALFIIACCLASQMRH